MSIDEVIGSIGVALLLFAFFLNVRGHLPRWTRRYQGMNALGAALAALASWRIGYVPFVVLELMWCLVALWALARPAPPPSLAPR